MGSFFYRLDESLLAILVSGHPVLSTRTLSASPLLLAYWQFMNVHDGFRVTSEWVFTPSPNGLAISSWIFLLLLLEMHLGQTTDTRSASKLWMHIACIFVIFPRSLIFG